MMEQGAFMSRRGFVGAAASAALGVAALALAGCGEARSAAQPSGSGSEGGAAPETSAAPEAAATSAAPAAAESSAPVEATSPATVEAAGGGSLVLYFSHTGENYGVGYIEEGNTAIVAKMIAEKTGSELFEVVPSEAYPEGYDECCDVALEEQHVGARPAYEGDFDISGYDTIYMGYPIWWGDLPMCLYTFIENHDWAGKTIHPFCTHAGSGLSGTDAALAEACKGASVGEGLAIVGTTAQNERAEAEAAVDGWLA